MHEHTTPATVSVDFPGPFTQHDVVVDEWRVPFLDAFPTGDDRVTLLLDRRFGLELSVHDAERIVPFLADAIAIALGYPARPHGDERPRRDPHPRPVRVMDVAAARPEVEETG